MKKLLFLLFGALFLMGCGGDKPEDVAISFIKATYAGDTKTMIKSIYFPEDELKKEGEKEMLEGKLQMIVGESKSKAAQMGGFDNVKVIEASIDSDNADINLEIKFKNGEVINDNIELMKTKKGWKVVLK